MSTPEHSVAAELAEKLATDIPELAPELRALWDEWREDGDEPPLFIVVGVLTEHVERAVDSDNPDELQRVCLFMERMAVDPDESVRNALQVGVLENLGDDRQRLEQARLAMCPATLALSHEIERFWGRET